MLRLMLWRMMTVHSHGCVHTSRLTLEGLLFPGAAFDCSSQTVSWSNVFQIQLKSLFSCKLNGTDTLIILPRHYLLLLRSVYNQPNFTSQNFSFPRCTLETGTKGPQPEIKFLFEFDKQVCLPRC